MDEERLNTELVYGLPVFKNEYRIKPHDDDVVKQVLRDKRTHILATCMAAYPFTPTADLAKEFGISTSTIHGLASFYGIRKSKKTRSLINSSNAKKTINRTGQFKGCPVEKVARNGRVVATYDSARIAGMENDIPHYIITSRCNGRVNGRINGFRYRYKK